MNTARLLPQSEFLSVLSLRLLDGAPQLEILFAHVWVQLFGELRREAARLYQLLHVRQIFETVGRGHAGCEFQLDQLFERDDAHAVNLDRGASGFGEADRLRLAVARILSRDYYLDGHAVAR